LNTVAFSVVGSKNAKITGSKIIKLTQMPKLRVAKIKGFTVYSVDMLNKKYCKTLNFGHS